MDDADYVRDPYFGFMVPTSCPGCPDDMLDPASSWEDKDAYAAQAQKLASMLRDNYDRKYA